MRINERVRYIGVNDDEKSLFEGLWPLPSGVSYNSYLVVDEKVALIDTVEQGFEDEFLANIASEIGDRKIDYLVVNHMEPDHSSLVAYMMGCYPDLKIIANAKTLPMLKVFTAVIFLSSSSCAQSRSRVASLLSRVWISRPGRKKS